jgi:WhiB family transcriptional regulator, redox-sensing transcriptional regulator
MTEYASSSKAWQRQAACRTPAAVQADAFFPLGRPRVDVKKLCSSCPVRAECLAFALEQEQEGIWGGTTTRERKEMRHEQLAG